MYLHIRSSYTYLTTTGYTRAASWNRIKETAQVAPCTLAGQIRIVGRRTDADSLGSSGEEVADVMR